MTRQRQPRLVDEGFLKFLRTQPCCVCGASPPSQAAHIRMRNLEIKGRETGKSEKPNDRHAVPLCGPDLSASWLGCHGSQHSMGEAEFWLSVDKDPFAIAAELYAIGGTTETVRKKPPPRKRSTKTKMKIPSRKTAWPKRPFRNPTK